MTSGTIESRNHVVSPVCAAFSNAHKQYAVIITPAETARTNPRYEVEYCPSVLRCPCDAEPSSTCSAWRFPVTMKSEPAPATIRNQSDSGTLVATPPATARNTKPDATAARSMTGSCLSHNVYDSVTST